jgi:hypothetical protein
MKYTMYSSTYEPTLRHAHIITLPVCIAIKDGQCKIGLSLDELEDLARAGSSARKCSTRELATVLHRTTTTTNNEANEKGTAQWGATTGKSNQHFASCVEQNHKSGAMIPSLLTRPIHLRA